MLWRVLRVLFLAGCAWAGFWWATPRGQAWVVWLIAGTLLAIYVVRRLLVMRRHRAANAAADRYVEALMDPKMRPTVIEELELEAARLGRGGARKAADHAQSSLVLAELLDADSRTADARAALDKVPLSPLDEEMRAIVVHARAIAALSDGDAPGMRAALDELEGACGDPSIDQKLHLARGLLAVEEENIQEALAIAKDLKEEASDVDIRNEARLLQAVALDAQGERERALRLVLTLEDDLLEVLHVLGLPRVKVLVAEALSSSSASA